MPADGLCGGGVWKALSRPATWFHAAWGSPRYAWMGAHRPGGGESCEAVRAMTLYEWGTLLLDSSTELEDGSGLSLLGPCCRRVMG